MSLDSESPRYHGVSCHHTLQCWIWSLFPAWNISCSAFPWALDMIPPHSQVWVKLATPQATSCLPRSPSHKHPPAWHLVRWCQSLQEELNILGERTSKKKGHWEGTKCPPLEGSWGASHCLWDWPWTLLPETSWGEVTPPRFSLSSWSTPTMLT